MSRGKTRLFVVVCMALIFATAVFSVVYLRDMALDNSDRIEADSLRANDNAVRGFGVTDG
jgi:hypothetical protein